MTRPARSWLFVPADSERKLARAAEAGADAIILDLEDSVAPARKAAARAMAAEFLRAPRGPGGGQIWLRVNTLDSDLCLGDLAAVVETGPDGIVLPKAAGPRAVRQLGFYLDALEARAGLAVGAIGVMPVATETAAAPFRLGDYARAPLPRLRALTWGGEDLATDLRASTNRDESGEWAFTYRMVRSLTLLAARAAGVQPVDTLHADFRDEAGLARGSALSRAEGFTGRLAIHPAQIPVINAAYLPSAEEVAAAERVVAAFAAQPGAATVGLDGRMLDLPHLKQAESILASAKAV